MDVVVVDQRFRPRGRDGWWWAMALGGGIEHWWCAATVRVRVCRIGKLGWLPATAGGSGGLGLLGRGGELVVVVGGGGGRREEWRRRLAAKV